MLAEGTEVVQGALGEVLFALSWYHRLSFCKQRGLKGSKSSITKEEGVQKEEQVNKQDLEDL